MPATFIHTADINAPAAEVWRVMSDVDAWPQWADTVSSLKRLDGGGPLAPGARVRIGQPGLPPANWEVTALVPGESFTWVSRGLGVRVVAQHAVAAAGGSARVTLTLAFEGLLAPLMGALYGGMTRRYLQREAEGLARRCGMRRAA